MIVVIQRIDKTLGVYYEDLVEQKWFINETHARE